MKGSAPPHLKKPPSSQKLKLICSFGGEFTTHRPAGDLRYVGGDSRIISIDRRGITLSRLQSKVSEIRPCRSFSIKYQLPEPSSSQLHLVSIAADDDVRRMIADHDWLLMCGKVPRLRIFLCDAGYVAPTNPTNTKSCYPLGDLGSVARDFCQTRSTHVNRIQHTVGLSRNTCESSSNASGIRKIGTLNDHNGSGDSEGFVSGVGSSRRVGDVCNHVPLPINASSTKSDLNQENFTPCSADYHSVENGLSMVSFSNLSKKTVLRSRIFKGSNGFFGESKGFSGIPRCRARNHWTGPHGVRGFRIGFDGYQRIGYGKFCMPKCHPGLRPRSNISKLGQGRSHQAHLAKPLDSGFSKGVSREQFLWVNEGRSLAIHNSKQGDLPAIAKENHVAQHLLLYKDNPLLGLQLPKTNSRDNTTHHQSNLTQLDGSNFCGFNPPLDFSLQNSLCNLSLSTMPCSSLSSTNFLKTDVCAPDGTTTLPRPGIHLQCNKGDQSDNNPFNSEPLIAEMAEEMDNVHLDRRSDISIEDTTDLRCLEAHVSLDMVNNVAYTGKNQETMPSMLHIEEKANVVGSTNICSKEAGETCCSILPHYSHLASQELQTISNSDLEEIRELGSGTYGTVSYGKWKGSDVAVKRLKPCCFSGGELGEERLVAEFWKEAHLLGQLHHPNVVALYGVVTDGPATNLATVTEYMVNGSLKQVLQRKDRTIDRRKRLIIAMDAAFGMEYLHEKNVVHFDLKSHNFLVNMRDPHRPVCKIGDLGLSKVKQRTLVSGGVRGTIPWMAPELLTSKSNMVTEKVDVYSFGIVMWELLTGEEPYENMQSKEIIAGIIEGHLRPDIPSWCDPAWRSLMERCWSSDPGSRPPFSEIAKELRAIAASVNIK